MHPITYSASIPSLKQKHSHDDVRYLSQDNDIAMSMLADTFCSFTRNVIFKSCFLLSEYGSVSSVPKGEGKGGRVPP